MNGNLTIETIRTHKSVTFAFPLKNEIQLKKTGSAAKTSFLSKVITTKQENSTMYYHIAIKSWTFCIDVYKIAYVKIFVFLSLQTEIGISLAKIQEVKAESLGSCD